SDVCSSDLGKNAASRWKFCGILSIEFSLSPRAALFRSNSGGTYTRAGLPDLVQAVERGPPSRRGSRAGGILGLFLCGGISHGVGGQGLSKKSGGELPGRRGEALFPTLWVASRAGFPAGGCHYSPFRVLGRGYPGSISGSGGDCPEPSGHLLL